jgi:DNA-binding PadR family transcriptional regulator
MKDSLPEHWFQILLTLAGQDLHGLAITRDVFERTDGRMHLWPGMLYGALKQMTTRGYVAEIEAPAGAPSTGGGKPRFYRLTPLGRRTCAVEAERFARIVDAAREKRLLKGNRGA